MTNDEIREEILTTLFHELRHLVLEKNKLLPKVSSKTRSESAVEDYGRQTAQGCMAVYKKRAETLWKRTTLSA